MSRTYAEELRDEAARSNPYDMRKAKIADLLDRFAQVEAAAFEAYDCLGDAEDMRAILARICEPPAITHQEPK